MCLGAFRRLKWDLGFWNRVDVKRRRNKEYLVCEKADAIIAPSRSFKKWLVSFWKLPAANIEVIPHLFDFGTMNQNSAGKVTDSKPTNTTILFVGKLNAHKGVINLAKAAKNILEKYPSVEFILIGEDWPTKYKFGKVPMSEILKKIVNNDDRFTMTGKINYNELAAHYQEADICIFPSLWEAWGYTCTEAMSFGKAVIGSKYGGMADAIRHNENGLLIDPFEVGDIEQNLIDLVVNSEKRLSLGKEAKRSIENELAFTKILEQNISFYQKLLQE